MPVLLLALALAGCLPGGSAGERLYRRHCATCHGSDGGGGIQYLADEGANLIDGVWRYGGDPASIEMTLRDGQIARHPPWELSHQEIRELTDHVLALRGERR